MPLSLKGMSKSSSNPPCRPAQAIPADLSTRQSIKVPAKEEPQQGDQEERLKDILAGAGPIARELAAIARRLGLENSPSRWQSGRDGWFFGKKCIENKSSTTERKEMTEIPNVPTKISTLPPERQIIAYQTLLKTARLNQVAAYYRLHCEQLDRVRCFTAYRRILHRHNHKPFRQVFPIVFSRQDKIAKPSKLKRAARAVQAANQEYRLRAGYRAFARGLELLIETCEVRLQKTERFTPVDWRPYSERPRWADGQRGWTGLKPEGVDVRTVDNATGEESCSARTRREKTQAGLRARYARCFPRAADRRLATYAFEGRRDGASEVVRADGTEQATSIL